MKFYGDVEHMLPIKGMLKINFVTEQKVKTILSKKMLFKTYTSALREHAVGTF